MSGWGWLIALVVVVALLAAAFEFDHRRNRAWKEFTLRGPTVPPVLQQVFGGYARDAEIEGMIVLKDGIRVGYKDGQTLRFVPVADGDTLVWRNGELEVVKGRG